MKRCLLVPLLIFFFLARASAAAAETHESQLQELQDQIKSLTDTLNQIQASHQEQVQALQSQIEELKQELKLQRRETEEAPEIVYEGIVEAPSWDPALPSQPGAPPVWQSFNPDISVIGDFLGQYTSHENEGDRPDDEFIFRELEIDFSGMLDPYARADVVVSVERHFEEEDEHEHEDEHEGPRGHAHSHGFAVDLEEAYLTALTLPYGLQARVGRMREPFGKVNQVHLHALPWVNYPLMIQNYFGDHGLIGDGVEVTWLAPTSHYLELIYDLFNNSNDSAFAGEEYDDFVHLFRAKNLFALSDSATLELGGTFATAPNDSGHGGSRTWLEGADLTLKWIPPGASLYKGLVWQSEVLLSQKDTEERGQQDTWGMYSSLDYRFARRWTAALRYDYSEFPDFEEFQEHGYSAYLTFLQSEYVFWRLGYMFIDRNFADPVDEDEHLLWVQLDFGLGPHRAHQY
jgi:hypothetical protein